MPVGPDIDEKTLWLLIGEASAAGNPGSDRSAAAAADLPGDPMRQTPRPSCPRRDGACPGTDRYRAKAATIVAFEPGRLSVAELSSVLLAAEWTLAGCWAELTSLEEAARLQSGIAKLRAMIEGLKTRRRKPR